MRPLMLVESRPETDLGRSPKVAKASNASKTTTAPNDDGKTSVTRQRRASRARPGQPTQAAPTPPAVARKVRTRERASVKVASSRNVEELHKQLHAAVTVGAQLDALIALGLTDFDLRKLTKKSRTAIYAWRRENALPAADIAEIIDNTRYAAASLLSPHVPFNAGSLVAWLRARSMDLEDRRPLDALAEGEFQTVVDAGRRWVGIDPPNGNLDHGDSWSEAMARSAASN